MSRGILDGVNTGSLLGHTLAGLALGGGLSSVYMLSKAKGEADEARDLESGLGKDQIVVPLSRKKFLKAIAIGRKRQEKKPRQPASSPGAPKDVSDMSVRDLAALKKQLLRKYGECRKGPPVSITERTAPVSVTSKAISGRKEKSPPLRDGNGRFSVAGSLGKVADIRTDAKSTIADSIGLAVGTVGGARAVKYLFDKIMVNRQKALVDKSRKAYTRMINNEIDDVDEPYYNSKSAESVGEDRGTVGKYLGYGGLFGIGSAWLTGTLVYKIMENRRKAQEREADKHLGKFPDAKTVQFRFAGKMPRPEDLYKDAGFMDDMAMSYMRSMPPDELGRLAAGYLESGKIGQLRNPNSIIPDRLANRMAKRILTKGYGDGKGRPGLEKKMMVDPSVAVGLYTYLSRPEGQKAFPGIIRSRSRGKWYSGLADQFANTGFAKNMAFERIMGDALKSTSVPRTLMAYAMRNYAPPAPPTKENKPEVNSAK